MNKFTAKVRADFSAAHSIPDYSGSCCNVHGHNWEVEVAVTKYELDQIGLSTDLREIKKVLKGILEKLDHTDLNNNPFLDVTHPTAEHIAQFVYAILEKEFPEAIIEYVEVHEGPTASIVYSKIL